MRTRLLAAAAVLIVALAGCGWSAGTAGSDADWVDLDGPTLVGVWQSDHGAIEFTAGGDFYAADLLYMLSGPGDETGGLALRPGAAPASGAWSIAGAELSTKKSFVTLDFDVVQKQPAHFALSNLLARTVGGHVELAYLSAVLQVHYRRCEQGCPRVAPEREAVGVPAVVARDRLVGTWRDQHGAKLVLATDGSYAAEDLRFAYAGAERLLPLGVADLSKPLTATGTWRTQAPSHDPGGPQTTVLLGLTTVAGKPAYGTRQLMICIDGANPVLAGRTTDPSVVEQHVYRRTPQ